MERRAERRVERRVERRADRRQERRAERIDRVRDRRDELRDRAQDRRQVLARLRDRDRDRDDRRIRFGGWDDGRWDGRFAERGYPARFADGCPPGLAKKNPACMPPGQYRKLVGRRIAALDSVYRVPAGLRDIYRDTDDYYYRYGNGYLYRVDRDRDVIRALLPLFGSGLLVGQRFPYSYSSPDYYVPAYYQPFYRDTRDDYYRYYNGYMYEIDRGSGLIEDIIPMYGSAYGVGQLLPASYSYYNLPYPYRSHYVDSDDYYYRYAPGAIYKVDAETQLITAIVSLLTGNSGLAVGQPLPAGYGV